MTSHDRVTTALSHTPPDRVPVDFWATEEVYQQLQADLRLANREAVLKWAGTDLRYFNGPVLGTGTDFRKHRESQCQSAVSMDHWGVLRETKQVSGTRRDGSAWNWTYKHLLKSPLAEATSVADVEAHRWPTADIWDFSGVAEAVSAISQAGYAAVVGADRLDRTAQLKPAMYLRGTEQFVTDLLLEPELAECILEHIADYYLAYNRRLFEAASGSTGVSPVVPGKPTTGGTPVLPAFDIFFMGDDMGTQASTWVSPEMYRRFFKQRLAAYCELAHRYGAKTMYHTCGKVAPLVRDFIDAGLDILQSLQPAAMGEDLAWLKREYGRDLCFQGGIDIQGVLPHGTPEQVRQHVRSRAEILAPGGGYIFGTAHNILPDTPTENVVALVEAYREF